MLTVKKQRKLFARAVWRRKFAKNRVYFDGKTNHVPSWGSDSAARLVRRTVRLMKAADIRRFARKLAA
jgi:hypothetical protein